MKITWKMPNEYNEFVRHILFILSALGTALSLLLLYVMWAYNPYATRALALAVIVLIGSGIRINEDKS